MLQEIRQLEENRCFQTALQELNTVSKLRMTETIEKNGKNGKNDNYCTDLNFLCYNNQWVYTSLMSCSGEETMLNHAKKFILGGTAFGLYYVIANYLFGYVCPLMIFIGFPCPTCGLTRAGLLFFRGNFAESFAMHPLLIPTFVLIICVIAYALLWPNKLNYMKIPVVLLILTSLVVYMYRMVNLFPYQPPMVSNNNSVLHNIIQYIYLRRW